MCLAGLLEYDKQVCCFFGQVAVMQFDLLVNKFVVFADRFATVVCILFRQIWPLCRLDNRFLVFGFCSFEMQFW